MEIEQKDLVLDCVQFCLSHNYFWYNDTFYNQQTGTAMGAKLDDCIILWRGSEKLLLEFITYINANAMNIKFTSEHDPTKICFMDLEIFITNGLLKTRTFFKKTDINSYIDSSSCHYAPWIKNIPKGQINRIRRNCTDKEGFIHQANILKKCFVERLQRGFYRKSHT